MILFPNKVIYTVPRREWICRAYYPMQCTCSPSKLLTCHMLSSMNSLPRAHVLCWWPGPACLQVHLTRYSTKLAFWLRNHCLLCLVKENLTPGSAQSFQSKNPFLELEKVRTRSQGLETRLNHRHSLKLGPLALASLSWTTQPQSSGGLSIYLNWSSSKRGFCAQRYLFMVSSSLGIGSLGRK